MWLRAGGARCIRGDSMIGVGIMDDDLVIIRRAYSGNGEHSLYSRRSRMRLPG